MALNDLKPITTHSTATTITSAPLPTHLKSTHNNMEGYEPLETIGSGSFGMIRKVQRKSDGKIFAWKEVDYRKMNDREKQQLVNEVNILRKLTHPNIVKYHERKVDADRCLIYILMEYCEGGDLAAIIQKCKLERKMIAEDVVWHLLVQLILALHECHYGKTAGKEGSILHRDLKPENVFLDSEHNVKLGDFGLSKMIGGSDLSFTRTFVGTPYYMSPEIIMGAQYNRKSDIWALGCLLYEICTLKPPFNGRSVQELHARIKDAKFAKLPSPYSDDLNRVLRSMLQADMDIVSSVQPTKRPNTVDFFRLDRIKLVLKIREYNKKNAEVNENALKLEIKKNEIEKKELALKQKEIELIHWFKDKEAILHQRELNLVQNFSQSVQNSKEFSSSNSFRANEQSLTKLNSMDSSEKNKEKLQSINSDETLCSSKPIDYTSSCNYQHHQNEFVQTSSIDSKSSQNHSSMISNLPSPSAMTLVTPIQNQSRWSSHRINTPTSPCTNLKNSNNEFKEDLTMFYSPAKDLLGFSSEDIDKTSLSSTKMTKNHILPTVLTMSQPNFNSPSSSSPSIHRTKSLSSLNPKLCQKIQSNSSSSSSFTLPPQPIITDIPALNSSAKSDHLPCSYQLKSGSYASQPLYNKKVDISSKNQSILSSLASPHSSSLKELTNFTDQNNENALQEHSSSSFKGNSDKIHHPKDRWTFDRKDLKIDSHQSMLQDLQQARDHFNKFGIDSSRLPNKDDKLFNDVNQYDYDMDKKVRDSSKMRRPLQIKTDQKYNFDENNTFLQLDGANSNMTRGILQPLMTRRQTLTNQRKALFNV